MLESCNLIGLRRLGSAQLRGIASNPGSLSRGGEREPGFEARRGGPFMPRYEWTGGPNILGALDPGSKYILDSDTDDHMMKTPYYYQEYE